MIFLFLSGIEGCPVWGDYTYGFANTFGFDVMSDPPIALQACELDFPDWKGTLHSFQLPP